MAQEGISAYAYRNKCQYISITIHKFKKTRHFDIDPNYNRILFMVKIGFEWEYPQISQLSEVLTCLWQLSFAAKYS